MSRVEACAIRLLGCIGEMRKCGCLGCIGSRVHVARGSTQSIQFNEMAFDA